MMVPGNLKSGCRRGGEMGGSILLLLSMPCSGGGLLKALLLLLISGEWCMVAVLHESQGKEDWDYF